MATKLDRFLEANQITTTYLAKVARLSRKHAGDVRSGKVDPGQECIAKLLNACSRITKRKVGVEELFDFEVPSRKKVAGVGQ